jgi:hypothetical protein
MNSTLSWKMWPHDYHPDTHHGFMSKLARLTHNDNFWVIIGILVMAGLMILSLYVTVTMGPTEAPHPLGEPHGYISLGQPTGPYM